MLNRFADVDRSFLPEEQAFMTATVDLNAKYQERRVELSGLTTALFRHPSGRGMDVTERINAKITKEIPDLGLAISGLRSAIVDLAGWSVKFRQIGSGEFLGNSEGKSSASDKILRIVRAVPEFYESYGFVTGRHDVGFSPHLGDFGAWIELGLSSETEVGMFNHIGGMFEIEFTQPKQ